MTSENYLHCDAELRGRVGLYIPWIYFIYVPWYSWVSKLFESVRPFARRGAQISLIAHIWVLQWIWLKILTKFGVNKIFLAKKLTKLWHFIGSTWNNIFIAYLCVFKVIFSWFWSFQFHQNQPLVLKSHYTWVFL